MARKKVKLAWITNDATRRATFKKRKKGLLKKAQELSTLCDVKTCVVVYGGPQDREVEAWPSTAESLRILRRFRNMPETEQSKKMVDQEGFLRQRLAKSQEQLRRLERENRELETCLLMHDALSGNRALDGTPIEDATALAWLVEMRLRSVHERIRQLHSSGPCSSHSQTVAQLPGPSTPVPSQSLSLTHGLILPPLLPPPQMPREAAGNAPAVPVETSRMPAWYANPADSIGFLRTDQMMSMQPYLDAASAWSDYLHHK
ncbi:Agamous-like MADS-box protein AGL80 [Rhynchospora pubera]|uniref:Agamous-like MADS-box protein AGL80 n=1 Tax=Rhynchospora pubera TaxID=906938 RepID=A0AAV8E9F1_9POAL|nr:Agamous-like MADS-box protein AGL80 [Rhynchospora pubera]